MSVFRTSEYAIAKAGVGIIRINTSKRGISVNMTMFRRMVLFLSLAFVAARSAHAEIILETTSGWDGQYTIGNFWPGKVWGYTFKTPDRAAELLEASFWVQSFPVVTHPQTDPYTFDITGYLMAWDGEKGIQPILVDRTISVNTAIGEIERVDFNFDGVNVAADSQYVLFFNVSQASELYYLNLGHIAGDPYPDGGLAAPVLGNINLVSLLPWGRTVDDFAFEMRFAVVPEPSTFGLGLLGGFALLAVWLWRR